MKRILLLTTGGTIAARDGPNGLAPAVTASQLLAYLDGLGTGCCFESESLMELDSSNIQPEQWVAIARHLYQKLPHYDGFVVTHGTDTLAYTAAALSFMLPGLHKPVVLTGAQLPISSPLSDATTNLYTAFEAVNAGLAGVSIAFNRKIIAGTRAVKISTMGFDAFESVNAHYLGQVFADGLRLFARREAVAAGPVRLQDVLCTDVFLLKLLPGTRPELLDALLEMGYRGLVIEAFGAGGLHHIGRDLLSSLRRLIGQGVAVVICSQCLYERCDLSLYEVGRRLLQTGVIAGADMTTEAAATKLMWALGQTNSLDAVRKMFETSYAGEVSWP